MVADQDGFALGGIEEGGKALFGIGGGDEIDNLDKIEKWSKFDIVYELGCRASPGRTVEGGCPHVVLLGIGACSGATYRTLPPPQPVCDRTCSRRGFRCGS